LIDVLVDTSVWSIALRRQSKNLSSDQKNLILELEKLASDGRISIIGAIRQEILSGIKHNEQFTKLKKLLSSFVDLELSSETYILAASFYNKCTKICIQGTNTDFLICATAVSYSLPIFTIDRDFKNFQKVLPIKLYG
jgi:predicted nucleic acid-binding protein